MALAAIALGSNLRGKHGSRTENVRAATVLVRALGTVEAVSRWLETEPVGYMDQPRFVNGVLLLRTVLEPEALLSELLRIELAMGRDRRAGVAKGPRVIDLDLLLYDERVMGTERLVLPHPEMHRRRFVLEPLAEIAPGWRHPVLGVTVEGLLAVLPEGAG